jgi:hypothetical protein
MEHRGVSFEEDSDRLRISWDNRVIRKEQGVFWFFIVFWIVWAPVTGWATVQIFTSDSPIFFSVWCIFGWLGTFAIPHALAKRGTCEWIELDREAIRWGVEGGLTAEEKGLPWARVFELGLGRYSDRHEHESMVTLNVYETPNSLGMLSRHLLGYWLAREHKEAVFERIREFVTKRALPVSIKVYGES